MSRNDFDTVHFDYFNKTPSYVKEILTILENEIPKDEIIIISAIYNYLLNYFSDEKIDDIKRVSRMFIFKMDCIDRNDLSQYANFIYQYFLKKMMFDMSNREIVFNIMNDSVKVYVDYYTKETIEKKHNNYR